MHSVFFICFLLRLFYTKSYFAMYNFSYINSFIHARETHCFYITLAQFMIYITLIFFPQPNTPTSSVHQCSNPLNKNKCVYTYQRKTEKIHVGIEIHSSPPKFCSTNSCCTMQLLLALPAVCTFLPGDYCKIKSLQ